MLIPTDPDATRVEFQVPGVGLCAVLADGTVEYPEQVGETVHETEFGVPHTEIHVEQRTDKTGAIIADSTSVDSLVQAGVLKRVDDDKKSTPAKPTGSAPTPDTEG